MAGDPLRCSVIDGQQRLTTLQLILDAAHDDQLIFETLNDRGTPLLAADLIKNYVFQRLDDLGVDVDNVSDKYWRDFDEDWWRDQVSQGRLYRSRIDLFLRSWLTMRMKEEIPTDSVFSRFRTYASDTLDKESAATAFLKQLRKDADTFRDFAQLDPRSARGRFYGLVVEAFELGSVHPAAALADQRDSPHRAAPSGQGTRSDRELGGATHACCDAR